MNRNRLNQESSLYLRQHADNPVHWQPWDREALESARASGRPILLSIGYSACHWCHVMAHESFEDEETAELMNRYFVNIKVDREERPDLDRTYQLAHQLLTGRGGGWPLTVFLDPEELLPFFAGTYFPRERRYGMPAFSELLLAIAQWFEQNPEERVSQGNRLRAALVAMQGDAGLGDAPADAGGVEALLQRSAEQIRSRFDAVNGGFGGAPRFPQGPLLEAVAALGRETPDKQLERLLEFSLERMAQSGLRDHLDGGFFRYCVDSAWTIPHFEKMLYDNAMLLPLYAEGAARWSNPLLATVAEGIAAWLQSTMRQPSGGYAASIDADAAGEEGGFHVWSLGEVEAILDGTALKLFRRAYGLDEAANFEGRAWHLQRRVDAEQLSRESGLPEVEVEALLEQAREQLAERRRGRVHPTLDDKQLASWNALLAVGFVRAARALQREDWLDRAEEIVRFIRDEMWRNGGLMAVYSNGEARLHGYLDDHAWLLNALLELLSTRWSRHWLDFAIELGDALLHRFEDSVGGGFYFSDAGVEVPIARSMTFHDDATPSGNGSAVLALNRLGRLLGEVRYTAAAERCLSRAMAQLRDSPLGNANMLCALLDARRPPPKVIVSGMDPDACTAMKQWVESRYRLDCYLIGQADRILPGILGELRSDQPVAAWLCRGMKCLPPVYAPDELERLMTDTEE